MTREKILSIGIDDCEVQTFRAGGKGGQNQNKRETGVRVIHHPSGARGESREERSQYENKKRAFVRMAETPVFKYWLHAVTNNLKTQAELEAEVDRELADPTITKTEVRIAKDRWQEVLPSELKD